MQMLILLHMLSPYEIGKGSMQQNLVRVCHLRKTVEGKLTPSYVRVDGESGSAVSQLVKLIVTVATIHHQDLTSIKLRTGRKKGNRTGSTLSRIAALYLLKSPFFFYFFKYSYKKRLSDMRFRYALPS